MSEKTVLDKLSSLNVSFKPGHGKRCLMLIIYTTERYRTYNKETQNAPLEGAYIVNFMHSFNLELPLSWCVRRSVRRDFITVI
jgi:hypothetical protein